MGRARELLSRVAYSFMGALALIAIIWLLTLLLMPTQSFIAFILLGMDLASPFLILGIPLTIANMIFGRIEIGKDIVSVLIGMGCYADPSASNPYIFPAMCTAIGSTPYIAALIGFLLGISKKWTFMLSMIISILPLIIAGMFYLALIAAAFY